jgi:hypothetical protein
MQMRTEVKIGEAPKKAYSTPHLATHGDVSTLTQDLDDHHKDWDKSGCASHLFDHRHDKC